MLKNPAVKVVGKFGLAMYPRGPSGERHVNSGAHGLGVARGSKKLEAAADL